MKSCSLCENTGEKRKLFLEDELMCDVHYIEYLECLFNNTGIEITTESGNKVFSSLLRCRPESSNKIKIIRRR